MINIQDMVDKHGALRIERVENPRLDLAGHLVTRKHIDRIDDKDVVVEVSETEVHYTLILRQGETFIGASVDEALEKAV